MKAKIDQYKSWSICALLICCLNVRAQKTTRLLILPADKTQSFINTLSIKTAFISAASCLQYVQQLPLLLRSEGFISASVDSVKQDSSVVEIKLFAGEKYIWNDLKIDNDVWPVLNFLGYHKSVFNNKPFDPAKVKDVYERLLDYYSDNGYPFAKINLDSIVLNEGYVTAKLKVDKGDPYFVDSIRVYGALKISHNFLYRYLDFHAHELYSASKFEKINERLLALPYVQQTQPWGVTMLNTGAIINLYLQPKQSNQINALIGFLPANQQTGGKLLLTGEINLNLKNAFSNGEIIGLNWQQLQPGSPRLNILFQQPYLFHSPFGVDVSFDLYKQDSSYLNINATFGVSYYLSARQSGKIFIQDFSTTVLSVDTSLVRFTKQLPPVGDVSSVSIGLQYNFNSTNYPFNPVKGNELNFSVSAGNKIIKENNAILQIKDSSFNYGNLYDTIKLNSYVFRIRVQAAHYFKTGKQTTLKTAVNIGIFQSPNYFNNELFQIGGYKLLRGFDEESIFTNRFIAGSLEYRYLIGQNSYFFGFTDGGWANYQNQTIAFSHNYIGLGFGLAFETKTGIFNISYAVGRRDDTNFNLQQSKIHLGFVSVF